jgi:serine/threonine protein phosphatase 1
MVLGNWIKRALGLNAFRPTVPDGVCVYAVGDIHGRLDLMTALLEKIWADADALPANTSKTLIFLGDYVDRGPQSKQVIDYLIALNKPGWDIIKLAGNHEYSVLEFLRNPEVYASWRVYGGMETLLSYDVRPVMTTDQKEIARIQQEFAAKLPLEHLRFLSDLPYSYSVGDYFFAHAGARPGLALDKQSAEDLLWIRDEFLQSDQWFEKVVVHGHTPTERPAIRTNRIGIDTGAYATNRLTSIKLITDHYSFLTTYDM